MVRKAISIMQPYCHAILHCGKRVENRNWTPSIQTPIRLVIHAGKRWMLDGIEHMGNLGFDVPKDLPLGALVGEVTLMGARFHSELPGEPVDPWAFGPVCWELADPIGYSTPIPWSGKLGIFDVEIPDTVIYRVRMLKHASGIQFLGNGKPLRIEAGTICEARVNPQGAASVDTPGGRLGITPDEFEWVEVLT